MQIKYIEAFFLSDTLNELNIVTDATTIPSYNLYWTYELDAQTTNKTYLLTDSKTKLEFEFAYDKNRRQYFIIEFEDGNTYLFGHRILPIAGMYNFRDIGGYLTTTGQRLKWGVGYRSDYLYNLKDAGMDYIKSLGIKTIIDFRTKEEVEDRPNRNIGDDIESYVFDPNAHIARLAGSLQSNSGSDDEEIIAMAKATIQANENKGDSEMIDQQLRFVTTETAQEAFANTLKTLATPDANPSMQHCRGGKDRTGYGLMLLEGLLGVPKEMLIYDYYLTHRAREKKNKEYYERFLAKTNDPEIAAYMYSLFDTKKEYIAASIDKLLTDYGSIETYVKEVLGISDTEIATLSEIFLEKA